MDKTQAYRARLRAKISLLDKIPCECGCGETIEPVDDHNRPKRFKQGHQKGNPQNFVTDRSTWIGREHSSASRAKISAAKDTGSTSYWALHKWMQRHGEKSGSCEICGQSKLTEWAMRDHSVATRNRGDWLELCKSCHARYDIAHNGKKHGGRLRRTQ